jgi:GTP-binding protein
MDIKQSEFITSAVSKTQYPEGLIPEIAFVGRSNVGKSSIINALTNRRHLAKVSGTPGKTKLINFFLINNNFFLVDLPGYGYAKVSKVEKESWGRIVESYLLGRENLKKVVLLVDCRHKPTNDDIVMHSWIKHFGYNVTVVATKSDKLSKTELRKSELVIRETLKLDKKDMLFFFSSLKKDRKEELINLLFEDIVINQE